MTVTLNIDNKRIRLLSYRGNRVVLWQTLELPPGLIKNGQILDPQGVANLLKVRLQNLKLSGQQVHVCLSGLSYIYRVLNLPNLKNPRLHTAVMRATQREISLPLDGLYLDWQVTRQNPKEQEIFVLGISRQTVDDLLTTLKLAGISLQSLELKALSLARAVRHPYALVIDCEPDAFEILVVRSGVPVTIHRVIPKNEMATFEDNLNQALTELNRTIDYYNLNHSENPLTRATPVMLGGSLCDDPTSCQMITKGIGNTVEFFQSRAVLPPNFPLSTFAANLGLLAGSPNITPGSKNRLDLIKARRKALSHPVSPRQLATAGAVIGSIIVLGLIWFNRQHAVLETSELRLRALNLNQQLTLTNHDFQQNNMIREKIIALQADTQRIESEQTQLGGQGDLATILKTVTDDLPPGTSISRIDALPDKILVEGQTQNRLNIVNYIHSLEKTSLFKEVRLASFNSPGIPDQWSSYRIIIER
jgi:Tfp pilus assembly PilM family ATPase/Tfp pilus assembly protein PilN